jgi:chemotaxis protein MotB
MGQPTMEAGSVGAARGGTAQVPDASLRVMAEELRVVIDTIPQPSDTGRSVRFDNDPEGLRINMMDTARHSMFRGGTAELNPFGRMLLTRVARKLARSGFRISVEGHTDSVGGNSDSNWRLSGNRAEAAREAMLAAGLTPDRFSAVVAKAGTQPIYVDVPQRPENRRITIVLIGEPPPLPSDVSFKF